MSRTLSSTAMASIAAQESGQVWVVLLTIYDADDNVLFRVSSDNADSIDASNRGTISNGNDYYFFPFSITLPEDADNRPPIARLSIDNVDRQIIEELRNLTKPPKIDITIVLASTPNTTEFAYTGLRLRNITYDAMRVSGDLAADTYFNEPFPARTFTKSVAPGIF